MYGSVRRRAHLRYLLASKVAKPTKGGRRKMNIAFRKILICLTAVLALGGVSSAAASAAGPNLFISGAKVESTEHHAVETRIKSGTTFKLAGTLGTTAVTLESTAVSSTGAFIEGTSPASDGADTIAFTGTKVTSPATCTGDEVTSRKEEGGTKTAAGTVTTATVTTLGSYFETSKVADTFSPPTGKPFTEIELKKAGTCPIPTGFYTVTGHVAGEELTPSTEAEHKTLKFEIP